MYGFAQSRHLALSPKEIQIERSHYCGLCHTLKDDYGTWARLLTNFEGRFLSILVDAQSNVSGAVDSERCPLPPFFHSVTPQSGQASRFAASMTLYLLRQKLLDDSRDDNSRVARLLLKLSIRSWETAEEYLHSVEFPFSKMNECSNAQRDIELAARPVSLDSALEPSAQAMSRIFAFTSELAGAYDNREMLRTIGAQVGRIVCLLDACQDLRRDSRRGNYNLILHSSDYHHVFSLTDYGHIVTKLASYLKCIEAELDGLTLHKNNRLVKNTLTLGLAHQAKYVMRRMTQYYRWSRQDVALAHELLSELPQTDVCDPSWICQNSIPKWKRWIMEQEIRLRTGNVARLLEKLWITFPLKEVPNLQNPAESSALVLGSLFISTSMLQGGGCEEACGEACGGLTCCAGGLIEVTAGLLGVSPVLVALCCCCIAAAICNDD